MAQTYYPAILHSADVNGLYGVTVPGANVNASGATADEALADAVAILQELLDDFVAAGEDFPPPTRIEEIDAFGARIYLLPVNFPERSVRVNITLPADLVARIDAFTRNRSAFLAQWAQHGLRSEGR